MRHRIMKGVAKNDENHEARETFQQRTGRVCVRRPMPRGRHAERQPREQQENTRYETALKCPDVNPRTHSVRIGQQGTECVTEHHQDYGHRACEVNENDAMRADTAGC